MPKPEWIKLSPFELDGVQMLDIRYWRETSLGPRPTKKGIVIKQALNTRLIGALQRVHTNVSRDEAFRQLELMNIKE